jgi:uncharacterized protein with PQ loop repeat
MTGQDTLELVVSVWAVAMAVSPGLQIRQMLRTGESEDVSVGYFAVLTVGFILWVIYGISIDDMVLAVPNSIATIFGASTIVIALRLRGNSGSRAGVTESDA